MLEIDHTVISSDLLTQSFVCDLNVCKGACCVVGDSGAPLERGEAEILKRIFPKIKPFLRKEAVEFIEKEGTSVIDVENDVVTPLLHGKECAYVIFEQGIAKCGLEKAFLAGAISFRKPLSCHLYPVRIKNYRDFQALNYDRWDICKPAIQLGERLKTRVFQFTRDALERKFGTSWFNLLETAARNLEKNENQSKT
jgi:hypothetical protein